MFELLLDIYSIFGFYKEGLVNVTKKGKTGSEEIQQIMDNLRKNPPVKLAGSDVILIQISKKNCT